VEAEVSVFLGRDRYQRDPDARPGYRNGHQPVTVKTTAGPVTLERPKLRGTELAFASRLVGKHVTRTSALEALAISGYVGSLSTRDVEAALAEALGPKAALSRSTVSRVCEAIRTSSTADDVAWELGGLSADCQQRSRTPPRVAPRRLVPQPP
jgi:putative transposase